MTKCSRRAIPRDLPRCRRRIAVSLGYQAFSAFRAPLLVARSVLHSDIPPRVEAALNAVPAAVLTALVAPALVYKGLDVTVTLIVALLIGLRAPTLVMLVISWAFVIAFRHFVM